MSPAPKLLLVSAAAIAVAALASACGTQRISVPKAQGATYQGAVLFEQRCAGCHTLSYAATHGSAANVRTAQYNNGPNFNVRCERPIARVLYAIENGGFSGAIMPQNVVVGQQAIEVAKFVATYAGRQSPKVPGVPPCNQEAIGTIPSATATTSTSGATGPTGPTGPSVPAANSKTSGKRGAKKTSATSKPKP